MLIHPIQVSENYPIGMIIEAYAPPNDNWMLCDGQVLAKASYPALYALMDRPHPIFEHWEEVYADNLDSFGFTSNIVYGNGLWVAANGSDMAYSSDGETWTYVYFPTNSTSLYSLAYNGTIFVCKPYSSLTKYFTSTDGMAWTERNLPIAIKSYFISYDGTYFYLINEDSVNCLYSSNGIDWSTGTSLISASWFTHAASPDVLVVSADNSVNLAVSIDKMTTWKYYAPPAVGYPYSITYDSTDDIFIMVCDNIPVFAISSGDDGVNWDVRNLPVATTGNIRGLDYRFTTKIAIKRVGNYWFLLGWYSNQLAYSLDLKTWQTFPITMQEFTDVIYNSSTGYYYLYSYGRVIEKWKEITLYNSSTHFKLPLGNQQYDFHSMTKKLKYIRVK